MLYQCSVLVKSILLFVYIGGSQATLCSVVYKVCQLCFALLMFASIRSMRQDSRRKLPAILHWFTVNEIGSMSAALCETKESRCFLHYVPYIESHEDVWMENGTDIPTRFGQRSFLGSVCTKHRCAG